MKKFLLSFFVLCSSISVFSQDGQQYTEFSFREHCRNMYANAELQYSFDRYKPTQFAKWQKECRAALYRTLGIDVIKRATEGFTPKARQIDSEDIGYAVRERWELWTEPDVNLPFIVMRPKNVDKPVPLMITPHGHGKNTESYAGIYHSEQERLEGEEGERNVAVQAVQHGFIAIAPTARGFGKTRTEDGIKRDETHSDASLMIHDALVGRTPIGDRVWDIMRLIDWAFDNLPVDKSKVIVSGNSGGGTASLFAGAIDTRITMSIPGSAFCTFVGSIGLISHCDCNYVPGLLRICESYDVAGLTAPRYFCALNGISDPIFPIEPTRFSYSKVEEIYKAAGVPDNCYLYVGSEGHRYYKAGAWEFILKHIDTPPVKSRKK